MFLQKEQKKLVATQRSTVRIEKYLSVIVFVEIVNTSDAPAVAVGIVNVTDIFCVVARIAGDHGFGSSVYVVLEEFARRHGRIAFAHY